MRPLPEVMPGEGFVANVAWKSLRGSAIADAPMIIGIVSKRTEAMVNSGMYPSANSGPRREI